MTNRKIDKPLERSSYEFMAALVVASVVQMIPNWLGYLSCWIVLAGLAIYFCWKSPGTISYGSWRKLFLSACSIAFIASFATPAVTARWREANEIPPPVLYMTSWGPLGAAPLVVTGTPPRVVSGIPSALATVDGRLLGRYKNSFKLMVVVFHLINGESYMDKRGLSKSEALRIRPEDMLFKIDLNDAFLTEVEMGATSNSFVLLAIPRKMRPSDFDTLADAEDEGAQIIGKGQGGSVPVQVLPIKPQ